MGVFRMSIYSLIWILLLMFPFLSQNQSSGLNWNRVFSDWIRLIPFLTVFLIHHFGLLPLLVIRKRKAWYLTFTLALILGVSFLSPGLRFLNEWIREGGSPLLNPQRPPLDPLAPGPVQGRNPYPGGAFMQPLVFYNFLVSLLLVGFDAAISLASEWFRQDQRSREIEHHQVQTELAFLRNQVSPHFFMNTLNNIHALIDQNPEMAQDAVIRLSKMMRYLLYETGGLVHLKKELEFISSYFDLMRIRFDEKVKIHLKLPDNIPDKKISPLLGISFIENAFKHGISYQRDSYVNLSVEVVGAWVEFRISNSKHSSGQDNSAKLEGQGLGLANVKKQLTALFGEKHHLEIREEDSSFFVYLKIPLEDD